jgi:hypothetical protein
MRARDAATSARASTFEIAVATSSANWAMRPSVSADIGWVSDAAASIAPHIRPFTTIGQATSAVNATVRARAPIAPEVISSTSIRAGLRVRWTCLITSSPVSAERNPAGSVSAGSPQLATTVACASES